MADRSVGRLTASRMVNSGYEVVDRDEEGQPVLLESPDEDERVAVDHDSVH